MSALSRPDDPTEERLAEELRWQVLATRRNPAEDEVFNVTMVQVEATWPERAKGLLREMDPLPTEVEP